MLSDKIRILLINTGLSLTFTNEQLSLIVAIEAYKTKKSKAFTLLFSKSLNTTSLQLTLT